MKVEVYDNSEKAFEYECKRGTSFATAIKVSQNVKKNLIGKYPSHTIALKVVTKKIPSTWI